MKKILVASTNGKVISTVGAVCKSYAMDFEPDFFTETDDALSYIDYELPEIKILDFTSEKIDCNRILSVISADPWLHNGGIIAVVPNPAAAQVIEDKKDPNIIIVQTLHTFLENFSRLLRIMLKNQQFLFNRGMQESIGGAEKGSFICSNDPMDFRIYTTFLVSYLYSTNRINVDEHYSLQTALMELLTNALEHGNCNISYDEKTAWLEKGGNILSLIAEKNKDPVIGRRKIYIAYIIGKNKSKFVIKDEGNGFDWRKHLKDDPAEAFLAAAEGDMHGRGMNLSASLVSNLTYNEKGNQVSFEINNIQDVTNTVPGIMEPFTTINYTRNQLVCRENEPTTDLYFIVSGRFAVYSGKKLVSVLTPNDMFIGEMAFLLNDRRSASILSVGDGRLIKIPKNAFLNLIRKNPHYGIFLSKLLAKRLTIQTQKTLAATAALKELQSREGVPEILPF